MTRKSWVLIVGFICVLSIILIWAAGWLLTKPVPATFNTIPDGAEKVKVQLDMCF